MTGREWTWLVLALLPVAAFGRSEPALPEWRPGDRELLDLGTLVPGSVLLGEETIDFETGEAGVVVAAVAVPAPEPGEDVSGSEGDESNEIPEEFLAAYFEHRPEGLLVDPQQLLSRQEFRDRREFLRYHSEDSSIDLVMYLFDGNQEIPGEVRAEELVERFYAEGRPAAVVFYFLGAPQRSRMWLSPQIAEGVSPAEQRRALRSSVNEALEKSDPVDQFAGFAVQMSIRLYWMERVRSERAAEAEGPMVVFETREVVEAPGTSEQLRWSLEFVRPLLRSLLGVTGLLAGCVGGVWLLRRRFRYRFPELDVPRRLGGAHGAGIGAVLGFDNPAVSPSVQRRQMPDYLQPL